MNLLKKLYPSWLKPTNNNKTKQKPLQRKFIIKYKDLNVAKLTTDEDNNYIFEYTADFKKQYKENQESHVRKLAGFKEFKTYKSKYLYPFFISRIPDPNRPIIKEIVEKENIDKTDPLALLERFAKRTLDNPFVVEKQEN